MLNYSNRKNRITLKFALALKKSQHGSSLIELIVAIAILGAVLLPITEAFPYALRIINAGRHTTIASFLAQAKMEEVISLGYAACGIDIIEARAAVADHVSFERQTEIKYVDENLQDSIADTGLKKIIISVYYNSPLTKSEKTFTLQSLLTEK